MSLLLTEKEIRDYFEALVPEETRNELFNLLLIDYSTELLWVAQSQLTKIRNSPELEERIMELAKQEVHPYAKEPATPYEKHAVRRLYSFGLQILEEIK